VPIAVRELYGTNKGNQAGASPPRAVTRWPPKRSQSRLAAA